MLCLGLPYIARQNVSFPMDYIWTIRIYSGSDLEFKQETLYTLNCGSHCRVPIAVLKKGEQEISSLIWLIYHSCDFLAHFSHDQQMYVYLQTLLYVVAKLVKIKHIFASY